MYNIIENYCIEKDTIAELGAFSIIWGIAEEEHFGKFCTREKIENMDFEHYVDLYEKAIYVKEAFLGCFPSQPLKELRADKEWWVKISDWLVTNWSGKDFIQTTFYACFRIRNNLFHGEKAYFALNRQKDLFIAVNEFLQEFIIMGKTDILL